MSDHNQDSQIPEVPSSSPDFHTELAQELSKLVPEAIADGKVDVKKLKELLDGDVEDDSERFGLFWPGKKKAMRAAQLPTTATLKPAKNESKDWDTTGNVFIEGDNLEVLKVLQRHYHGKIKMIYIDPPYNTGKDFVYPDNFKEGLQTYLEFTKQVDEGGKRISTNTDASGRYHSNWLNMIYPRLKLARNLLTDDGVIFISIDGHEVAHLRKVCDEVFGEGSFVAMIAVNRTSEIATENTIQKHEYLACYCRNFGSFKVEGVRKYSISRGTVGNANQTQPKIEFPAGLPVHNLPDGIYKETRKIPGSSENIENYNDIVVEDGRLKMPVVLRARWRSSNDMRNFFANKCLPTQAKINGVIEKIYFENDRFNPQIKKATFEKIPDLFLENNRGSKSLEDLELKGLFDNPKSTSLIANFIKIVTQKNDIILDFFSGSATTAHAVMELNAQDSGNRKHIQVQLPEPTDENSEAFKAGYKTIAEIAKERIRRAGEKIKADYADKLTERETPLDVGFRVYKLADTNFAKWQVRSDDSIEVIEQSLFDAVENVGSEATEQEILTELMLKMGLSLTANVDQIDIAGLNVWSINDGSLMAYLANVKPTLEQLREVAGKNPAQLVVLDRCFAGDDQLKTNLAQACKTNNIELRTV